MKDLAAWYNILAYFSSFMIKILRYKIYTLNIINVNRMNFHWQLSISLAFPLFVILKDLTFFSDPVVRALCDTQ